ncbi:hypothetical protein BC829DRAFT_416352 [Chytridium lagenaria]|nr:hypothetical protein BC829DRAFT_416352 [Chytridium lagenaria]
MSLLSQNTRYLLVGTAFGFVLEKAKVYVPNVIVSQMKMENFIMMQVFLTATGVGMVFMSVAENLKLFKRSPRPFTSAICGAMIGAGMALSGACPGTVFAQVGAGIKTAWWTLIGAILASVSYGYAVQLFKYASPCFGKTTPVATFDGGNSKRYLLFATGASVAITGALFGLNKYAPWEADFVKVLGVGKEVTVPFSALSYAWNPVAAGMMIGTVQLLSMALTASSIGASSVYSYVGANLARVFDHKMDTRAPFFKSWVNKTETLFMAIGIVAGSAVSAYFGGVPAMESSTISPLRAVIGGVSLAYGARIAGGCTSGHGISGMAQLSPASFVTVASMFAGGFLMSTLL